ncbi:hypothetical protein [Haloferula sp. A504]|uniref:hypothetical protein n=1 Tax=Haloferula sp. A504 TaxID=3373601 RepID=UPI0031C3DB98|nr:hypothetical protein [Verrucomicrobiaceae bacterium E54]
MIESGARSLEMDAFEELGLERRLVLGEAELDAAFAAAGKKAHPDAGGTKEAFERVGRAKATLASPVSRLRHWLELEGFEGDLRGTVSAGMMDVFAELGALLQQVDGLLREREKASSALAKAMLEGRTQAAREELEAMQEKLEAMMAERVAVFSEVEGGGRDGWELARELGFLEKWRAGVRERFAGLW